MKRIDGKELQRAGPWGTGTGVGGMKPGDRFTGNCIRGVGKRWGVLRFIDAPARF